MFDCGHIQLEVPDPRLTLVEKLWKPQKLRCPRYSKDRIGGHALCCEALHETSCKFQIVGTISSCTNCGWGQNSWKMSSHPACISSWTSRHFRKASHSVMLLCWGNWKSMFWPCVFPPCHFLQDVFDPELPQWHLCPRTERHWPYLHLCPGLQIAHTVIQTLNGDARYMVVNPTSPVLTCFNPDYFRGLRSVRIKGGVLCNPFTRWDWPSGQDNFKHIPFLGKSNGKINLHRQQI